MRYIWNMTADAGKGKSKQHLIKMFLFLESLSITTMLFMFLKIWE